MIRIFCANEFQTVCVRYLTRLRLRMESAKRCFHTGSVAIAGYMPTQGDAGGPITFLSADDKKEYQVSVAVVLLSYLVTLVVLLSNTISVAK